MAAQVAPDLGTAFDYAVLGTNGTPTSGTMTCTTSTINGNVGSTFNSMTNTGCTVTGTADTPVAASVVSDFTAAYSALDSANPTCDGAIPTTSTTVAPGVYCSAAGTTIGAGVILTLSGSATDVWIFKVGTSGFGALTGNSFQVVMAGGALPCNVYWRTAEAATVTASTFVGTVLAGTAFTATGGSFLGRAMASTDATVTSVAPMTFAGCLGPGTITVSKDFIPNSPASVAVSLTCTSGSVLATPLNASEASPAVFEIGGADPGVTCTATETVPAGYTADESSCLSVPLGGSCTITNSLDPVVVAVPTLSGWGLMLLAAVLGLLGLRMMRRRSA
ncbi:MAG: IPTL-CTERM sorting domain-containing protein [Thermoanaerobaculia bacterium]